MRSAKVYYKKEEAGLLIQLDNGSFTFQYKEQWLERDKPSISLTLPKSSKIYRAEFLFPFFYNMLPEGVNRQFLCKHLRIDSDDYFGLLLHTAQHDTIGAVTIAKIINKNE
jgi:HipA-like protein